MDAELLAGEGPGCSARDVRVLPSTAPAGSRSTRASVPRSALSRTAPRHRPAAPAQTRRPRRPPCSARVFQRLRNGLQPPLSRALLHHAGTFGLAAFSAARLASSRFAAIWRSRRSCTPAPRGACLSPFPTLFVAHSVLPHRLHVASALCRFRGAEHSLRNRRPRRRFSLKRCSAAARNSACTRAPSTRCASSTPSRARRRSALPSLPRPEVARLGARWTRPSAKNAPRIPLPWARVQGLKSRERRPAPGSRTAPTSARCARQLVPERLHRGARR